MTETHDIDTLELDTTCDGLWLLLNTAAHNGFRRTDAEIREHIRDCEDCAECNAEHL